MFEFIFVVIIPLLLLIVGFSAGTLNERRHLRRLTRREASVDVAVTNVRGYSSAACATPAPTILIGEIVIATDYFKTFAATLKKLIGGELKTYESLLARARRDALLQLQEQAQRQGFNALCNLRLDTANVGGMGSSRQAKATMVAVLASATAYRVDRAQVTDRAQDHA